MLEHLHEAIRQSISDGVDWTTFRQLVQASYFAQAVDISTIGREIRKSRG